MRQEVVVESSEATLTLSAEEADALREAGLRLSSRAAWWGDSSTPPSERRVIRVEMLSPTRYGVRVADAVGVLAVGSLQIVVMPKIPLTHFLYLLSRSGRLPRLDVERAHLAAGDSFWTLIATWFVRTTEILLHQGLVLDYRRAVSEVQVARGHLLALQTAQAYYSGRMSVHCAFDEFCCDSPHNRALRAAASEVASSPLLAWPLRRRAMAIVHRTGDAGDLRPGDTGAVLDRRTRHYADAWALALHVLAATGRTLSSGAQKAWTFLLRTPELVEDGVRSVLEEGLGQSRVQKKGMQLAESSMTFNPDLLFDQGLAVGDVKYKLSDGQWASARGDFEQAVTFAEAFGVSEAAVFRFRVAETAKAPPIRIGQKTISEFTWSTEETVSPAEAGEKLVDDTGAWLAGIPLRLGTRGVRA